MIVQSKSLNLTRIHSASELAPCLDAWRELAASAPMQSPEWLLAWWKNYATHDDELCVLLLHEPEGALVGIAPLYMQGRRSRATLRILGAAESCTHHTSWLTASGWETVVGIEIARFLLGFRSYWKQLFFESIDADAEAIKVTIEFLDEKGCLCHQRAINSCWKILLPATWEEYLRTLSKSLRKRCQKLQREFLDSGQIQIRQVGSETNLKDGFEILLKLHSARWGDAKKPSGVFSDERFRKFHEEVSRQLLNRQQLRLAWLECDGKPIAVEYQFFGSKTVYAYQAGIDMSMDQYSPGKLTMMAAIQFAISQGCQTFDLLRGDEPYKANWRAVPMACHDLRVWKTSVTSRLEWAMWSGYTFLAQRLKPIIPVRIINLGLRFVQTMRNAFSPTQW